MLRTFEKWLPIVLLCLLYLTLTFYTWRKSGDPQIDLGVELYVPWRITEGDVLYRDIAHFKGPLSVYYHALLFRVFGASLRVILLSNLAIIALISATLHAMIGRLFSPLTAFVSVVVFLIDFAFAHLVDNGVLNFLTPYSHEVTHGTSLSIAALFFLMQYHRTRHLASFLLGAFCVGLVFLTRSYIFLAALAMSGIFILVLGWERRSWCSAALHSCAFLCAAVIPVAIAVFLLHMRMPWTDALAGLGTEWKVLLFSPVVRQPFFQFSTGMDMPARNALLTLLAFMFVCGWAGFLCFWTVRSSPRKAEAVLGIPILFLLLVLSVLTAFLFPPFALWRGLPFLIPVAAIAGWHLFRKSRLAFPPFVFMLLLGGFAFCMLPKILLYARLQHFGFAHAMAGTILVFIALFSLLPAFLPEKKRAIFLTAACFIALLDTAFYWSLSTDHYRFKTFPVGAGTDRLLTYAPPLSEKGPVLTDTLTFLQEHLHADETLTVLPEGAMLNYLARRRSSIPYPVYVGTEAVFYGEDALLSSLQASPPDYIVLLHQTATVFGYGTFGSDPRYGTRAMAWINDHYERAALFGSEPFRTNAFGALILRRNDPHML